MDEPTMSREELLAEVERLRRRLAVLESVETEKDLLKQSWNKYAFIANSARDSMTLINRAYVYETVNQAYLDAIGMELGDVVGRSLAEVWGAETFETAIRPNVDRCFAGEVVRYESWFDFHMKGRGYFEVIYHPFAADAGGITHAVVVTHDATARKEAEDELRYHHFLLEELVKKRTVELEETNRELQAEVAERRRLERLREDLERTARHDLKGPLNAVVGMPSLLLADGNLTERQQQLCRRIQDAGAMLLEMTGLGLWLYKMETGAYRPEPVPVDMLALARRVAGEFEAPALARNVSFDIRLAGRAAEPGDAANALGEEALCYAMLFNLVNNAVEASPDGAVVQIELDAGAGALAVRVGNEGEVPPEMRQRFFEKYATSGKPAGTGLGTYSVKRIAEALGGEASAEFATPGYTAVTVVLPAA